MNANSNAVPENVFAKNLAATHPFYWSVRRELWEYRSIYLAPLIVAGVSLFGFLVATMGRALATSDLMKREAVLTEPYHFVEAAIMGAAVIVQLFYCLAALHDERRDRSILFWKSLPVSDATVVLSKALIPFVVLPMVAFTFIVTTQFIMLLAGSLAAAGSGLSVAGLWNTVSPWQRWAGLLYHLVTVHMLWYAPIYAWLLFISGWARRAPLLWATLPLLAVGVLEKFAFNTMHFAELIGERFTGGMEAIPAANSQMPYDPGMHATLGRFLMTPGLWAGLVLAAIFLFGASRLRRSQGPI
jgi:ABC-2 type transport system permease protein